ncbi:MAG TPA: glutamine--tRNA ligase/YqeY domain fusion protein, partial [Thermoanaerobaculia bacterium]
MSTAEATRSLDFIREIIEEDLRTGKHATIVTRFPPEPNGYLHIGHAKSICLNFGIAAEYGGKCNLRFDDTNPTKEEAEFAHAIERDVHWLGFQWSDIRHASDYFEQLYEWAEHLVRTGKAYVDSLSAEEMRELRGTLTEAGKNSPYRGRSAEENLDLFRRMRAGEFPDGAHVLRAKIDMSSPNVNMRDPVLYRIRHETHHRTGDKWCIYPMYDMAHPPSDAIEHVTHSLCTLEFEDHRPLYDWLIENLPVPSRPRQIEFARLNLNYTVMSKRKLLRLVEEGHVRGWDDPRMPTIAGLRRRGYTPESIRSFADRVGVARRENVIDVALLEFSIREHLNRVAPRVMGVLRPLKVVIENYPEGAGEEFETANNPEDPSAGTRRVPFSRTVYIERDDFLEDPPKKFFRLAPGREVRLRSAYFITCTDVVKNDAGEIVELRATYDPATRGGDAPDGRRPKATLHWVSAEHAIDCEVRLYDRLFTEEDPEQDGNFLEHLNPHSLEVIPHAK